MSKLGKFLPKGWRLPSITGLVRRKITLQVLEGIQNKADEKLAVLDVGSGINNWSVAFSDDSLDVYHTAELDTELEATYHGDFFQLDLEMKYDVVIATEFIEHIPDPRLFFEKARSFLKDSGILVISFPFMFKIHGNPDDYYRYTASGVRALSESFFDIELIHAHGGKSCQGNIQYGK